MSERAKRPFSAGPSRRKLALAATVLVVLTGVASVGLPLIIPPSPEADQVAGARVVDETQALRMTFDPGVVLAGGSNATSSLLGGIGVYHAQADFSLPVLASGGVIGGRLTVSNLTGTFGGYFAEGGVYAVGWNGSAWLVGGQSGVDNGNNGTLFALGSDGASNLTVLVHPYFVGGGIWAVGWNGTDWLVGGNSTSGPVLVVVHQGTVANISVHVPSHLANSWIQMLAWNGTGWLVGGQGIFGLLQGEKFVDLYDQSPFLGYGAFCSAWSGNEWLVGGDSSGVALVKGTAMTAVFTVPTASDRPLVTLLMPLGGSWLVGGRGHYSDGSYAPMLWQWGGLAHRYVMIDLSSSIPDSFAGGEIQGGFPAPEVCSGCYFAVGEGLYDSATGHGLGAVALLAPSNESVG